jgi:hypothetical protein
MTVGTSFPSGSGPTRESLGRGAPACPARALSRAADFGNHHCDVSNHVAASLYRQVAFASNTGLGEIVAASADARVRHLGSPCETF